MSTRERIKEYIKKNYPEWDGNEDFLVNVETLLSMITKMALLIFENRVRW